METRNVLVMAITAALCGATMRAAAQDEPVSGTPPVEAPRLRGRPAIMPADGALLIEGGEYMPPAVMVVDASGAVIEGTVRRVGGFQQVGGFGARYTFAWLPSEQPALGLYEATLLDSRGETQSSVQRFEVVAPFARGLPPIESEPSATLSISEITVEQCRTPAGRPIPASRFATEYIDSVRIDAGLWSSAGAAQLDQFLFRLNDTDLDRTEEFVPFEEVEAITFSETADQHCIRVEALNIATLEAQAYDFVACAAGVDQPLGLRVVEPTAAQLAIDRCTVPPSAFEDAWCTVNGDACDVSDDACELYAFVCNRGVVSTPDKASMAPDSRAAHGCSVAAAAKAPSALSLLALALALPVFRQTRKRNASRTQGR